MFRRKRSFSYQQPLSESSSQSAQSAASHAFLKSQSSSGSLSSAAAAAAMRGYSPASSPVENTETRRTLNRRASLSQVNLGRSSSKSSLHRSSSSASMTERTFREQSPRRPATSSGPADVPPLPAIPPQFAARKAASRRSASVDATVRPSSTPPKSPSAHGMSVDGERRPGTGHSSSRIQGLTTVPEVERSPSRSSVNFSYPRKPAANPSSPPLAPVRDREVSTPPTSRSMEVAGARRSVSQSGRRPVNKRSWFGSRERNHVSPPRSSSAFPPGSAVAAAQAASLHKDDATTNHTRHANFRSSEVDGQAAGQAAMRSNHKNPAHHPAPEVRQPHEGEVYSKVEAPSENFDHGPVSTRVSNDSPAKLVEHTKAIHNLAPPEEPPAASVASASGDPPQPQHISSGNRFSAELDPESREPSLRHSASPPRSARFSNNLSIAGFEQKRHPPPRSISPVKPALKQNPKNHMPPDGRAGFVGRPGQAIGEMSDGTSIGSDDGSKVGCRRKPAKVSFDDETEIVGVAASPPTSPEEALPPSPPGKSKSKTTWFGAGKRKTSQGESFGGDEFDDVLKPRPALPSFGSIRGDRDQRKPVTQELNDNETTASTSSHEIVTDQPLSSDHALGGLLQNAQSEAVQQQNEVDHSTPPNANGLDYAAALKRNLPVNEADGATPQAESFPTSENTANGPTTTDSITQGSPATADPSQARSTVVAERTFTDNEKGKSSLELFRVPGAFPRASLEMDPRPTGKRKTKKKHVTADDGSDPKSAVNGSDGESGDSAYSEAAEDLDGDGFGSINAIMSGKSSERMKSTETSTGGIQPAKSSEANQTGPMAPLPEDIQPADSPSSSCPPLPPKSQLRTTVPKPRGSKRTMSVDAHATRNGGTNGILPQESSDTLELRQKPNQGRSRRPMSVGPGLSRLGGTGQATSHPQLASHSNFSRPLSNGSDSSSNFKLSTSPSKGSPQPSMRRPFGNGVHTLRGQSASPMEKRSQRPASFGSFSSSPGMMPPTLRTGRSGKTSFFSTGKSPRRSSKSGILFKSRVNDSDDEDIGSSPRAFQSRYAYSSDEDDAVTRSLSPVRGIPRRQGANDGDSTELEDSSEGDSRPASRRAPALKPVPLSDNTGLAAVARSRGTTREALEEFLRNPPRDYKPGFLRRFGAKKQNDADGRARKSPDGTSRLDAALEDPSAKGREKPMINGHGQSNGASSASPTDSQPSSPTKPSKRGIKKYKMTENWSLNSKPKETPSPEPATVPRTHTLSPVPPQTSIAQKRSTYHGPDSTPMDTSGSPRERERDSLELPERSTSALDVVISPTGRKRRFPSLRKAFGLRT